MAKIAAEAAKQCGRNDIPDIEPFCTMKELLERHKEAQFIIPYEREEAPLHTICQEASDGPVVIVIGPEGGFASAEIETAQEKSMSIRCLWGLVYYGPKQQHLRR